MIPPTLWTLLLLLIKHYLAAADKQMNLITHGCQSISLGLEDLLCWLKERMNKLAWVGAVPEAAAPA